MIKLRLESFSADSPSGKKAADILKEELEKRTDKKLSFTANGDVIFRENSSFSKDEYDINTKNGKITLTASSIRGFIYAIGMFLRKTVYKDGEVFLTEDISGKYTPSMEIRGHQMGYRDKANSYEAWSAGDYYNYIKEMMYFGCNVFEHVFDKIEGKSNSLMKKNPIDFIIESTGKVRELDIDVSVWYPNEEKAFSERLDDRIKFFEKIPRANYYFPPGSDPGEYPADQFITETIEIAKEIKKIHPGIKVYPSAQAPHDGKSWGDAFINEMEKLPEEIDGIITGPNCAMPLHELRERLPLRYPIRLYPDITHNVRCEYPVHFDRDDWHYALAATLSREAINPRPTEYRTIHRMTRQYINGSVSYSEGINDDVNKFVWSDMDFFPDVELTDTLSDYARLFFYGADTEKAVNGILGLEKNWEGDPAENPHIENTLGFFEDMEKENPGLLENARFLMLLFRAKCDMLVKIRRKTELRLIKDAKCELRKFSTENAEKILRTPFSESYINLRNEISEIGKKLFEKVSLQLDTEHYFAESWERGATLDTIDNPVTDRAWLLGRLEYAGTLSGKEREEFIRDLLARNKIDKDEYFFSFAENSFTELGVPQEKGFYMDFQGDRPHVNNGTIPMSMLKVFDHYSFRMKTGGLTSDKGYNLILNIKPRYNDKVTDFQIKINGNTLYRGKQYGGERDTEWETKLSAPGFECRVYPIPDEYIRNGCVELEISEPIVGVMISEVFIKKIRA